MAGSKRRRSAPAVETLRPWRIVLIAGAFGLLTALVFGPAISAPFDSDDGPSIANNLSIRQLWPPSVPLSPPSQGTAASGRPITNYSLAVDYAVNRAFGVTQGPSETIVYHATNMLLHVLVALLLFGLIRRTIAFGNIDEAWRNSAERIALIAAALWLVHPIQTEAVDYLSQRTELLVSFFYLATLYATSRAFLPTRAVRAWLATGLIASVLGMASKEVMLTAPFAVLLYDRAFISPSWRALFADRARRVFYALLFATILVSLTLVFTGARSATVGFGRGMAWYEYFYTQCWAVAHYLRLILWPAPLLYSYGREPIHGLTALPGAIVLTALAVVTILCWRRTEWRWAGFLGAFFFVLLAPSSSVVPIVTEIAAERRVYLASGAVVVLLVVAGEAFVRRLGSTRGGWRSPLAFAAGAIALAFSIAANRRSAMYTDPGLLWRDVVAHRPDDARALIGVAHEDIESSPPRYDEADALLRRAIAIDSSLVQARAYRAAIAIRQSRFTDAESLLVHAVAIDSLDPDATAQLGELLLAQNRPREAIPYLSKVSHAFPSLESYKSLGLAYLVAGALDSAVAPLQAALRIAPNDADALHSLAGALIEAGRGAEAIPVLARAVEGNPSSAELLAMSSLAHAQAHRVNEAVAFGSRALAQQNEREDPDVDLFVGRAMETAGKLPDAARLYLRAASMRPEDPQAPTRLAGVVAALGDRAKAIELLKQVLARAPGYAPARTTLQRLETKG